MRIRPVLFTLSIIKGLFCIFALAVFITGIFTYKESHAKTKEYFETADIWRPREWRTKERFFILKPDIQIEGRSGLSVGFLARCEHGDIRFRVFSEETVLSCSIFVRKATHQDFVDFGLIAE